MIPLPRDREVFFLPLLTCSSFRPPATIVHVFLYYRKQIVTQARRSLAEQPDIHARLMSQYPQVPEWWYGCIFLLMFVFGVVSIEIYPTQMPVWGFVLALAVAFIYTIPIGIIQAVTNQQIGLNVIAELIAGYLLPGRPLAMMLFKTWGYVVSAPAYSLLLGLLSNFTQFRLCRKP